MSIEKHRSPFSVDTRQLKTPNLSKSH